MGPSNLELLVFQIVYLLSADEPRDVGRGKRVEQLAGYVGDVAHAEARFQAADLGTTRGFHWK